MPDVRELRPGELHLAAAALLELRPHLATAEALTAQAELMVAEGYRVAASFAPGDAHAAAAAGFRIHGMLAHGRMLYVDDLSSRAAHRGAGYAGALMDWLEAEARRAGCDALHLDSGVLPERTDAHRLYLNKRLQVTSLHFARRL